MFDWHGATPDSRRVDQPPSFWNANEYEIWRALLRLPARPGAPAAERSHPGDAGGAVGSLPAADPVAPLRVSAALRAWHPRPDLTGPLPVRRLAHVVRGLSAFAAGGTLNLYLLATAVDGLPAGLYATRRSDVLDAVSTPADWPERVAGRVGTRAERGAAAVPAFLLWHVVWADIIRPGSPVELVAVHRQLGAAELAAYLLAEEAGLAGYAAGTLPAASDLADLGWEPDETAFVGTFALGVRSG